MSSPVVLDTKDSQEERERKLKILVEDLYKKLDLIGTKVVDFNSGEIQIKQVPISIETDE
jgi:hypothetical protein